MKTDESAVTSSSVLPLHSLASMMPCCSPHCQGIVEEFIKIVVLPDGADGGNGESACAVDHNEPEHWSHTLAVQYSVFVIVCAIKRSPCCLKLLEMRNS